ncbi:MAG: hypothetical protein ABFC18_03400 [Rikenellaceae bacterium]
MKPQFFNNQSCPECGHEFRDIYGIQEIVCPECYTELKVKYDEMLDWFYISDDYISLHFRKLRKHYQTQNH